MEEKNKALEEKAEEIRQIRHPKKRALLEALIKSMGIVTPACMKTGIHRSTHYRWLKEDEEYKAQVEDINNIALDASETSLFTQIAKYNTTATIFHLKTKGKHRGYVERIEHSGVDDKPIIFKEVKTYENKEEANDN
tara:strand:- start:1331 stop:1741 length:411 start_codon:yes stop_codon:yes gene_type:complete